MNVADLIAELSKLDPTMRVVVNGFESGFDILNEVRIVTVGPWQPSTSSTPGEVPDRWGSTEREKWDGELVKSKTGEQVVWLPRNSE